MANTFIGKAELAHAYFPMLTEGSARNHLMNLINANTSLKAKLTDSGYNDRCRSFSPLQVDLIVSYFGNPLS